MTPAEYDARAAARRPTITLTHAEGQELASILIAHAATLWAIARTARSAAARAEAQTGAQAAHVLGRQLLLKLYTPPDDACDCGATGCMTCDDAFNPPTETTTHE